MPEFTTDDVVELGHGVVLRAVEVSGEARDTTLAPGAGTPVRDAEPGSPAEYLSRAGAPPSAAAELGAALADSGMRLHATVGLPNLTAPRRGPVSRTRGPSSVPRLELEVDAPVRADEGQLILEVDATGHLRWHLPIGPLAGGGRRGAGAQRFDIPVDQFATASSGSSDRGLIGYGVGKVLHLIRFPVERAAGWVAEKAVGWWEERNRPYRLHLANPDGTVGADADPGTLAALGDGPFLLFLHGCFSTGASFGGLHRDRFPRWHEQYGGRLLVFDHPTVATPPDANARWLLDRLPSGRRTALDVVTHSRGGLVGRHLLASDRVDVRRLVQVAAPNAGTVLARKERIGDLLDTFTNTLSLVPDSFGAPALQGMLEVVKQVALGALSGLDGLAAMDPDDEGLKALNAGAKSSGSVHAITTDYQPPDSAALAAKALNAIVDALFGGANDLVVPTEGMARADRFVIDDPYVVAGGDGISHCEYFSHLGVRDEITRCLALPT